MALLSEAAVEPGLSGTVTGAGYYIEREEDIGPDADVSKGKRTELVFKANSV
jgi:hypothetical protein